MNNKSSSVHSEKTKVRKLLR